MNQDLEQLTLENMRLRAELDRLERDEACVRRDERIRCLRGMAIALAIDLDSDWATTLEWAGSHGALAKRYAVITTQELQRDVLNTLTDVFGEPRCWPSVC